MEDGPSVGMGRMHGSTARLADEPLARSAGPTSGAEDLHPLAQRLIREFRAPVGLLDPVSLNGIYDLGPLNAVLKANGEPQVSP